MASVQVACEAERLDPQSRRVPILANPRAGSGKSRRLVEGLVLALRRRGMEPWVCWQREELSALVDESGHKGLRCIVAAGGDGTLLEVVNRAAGVPVAVLPLGNENLVARHFGVSRSGPALAEMIAAGQIRHLDLARANKQMFCLMASVGFDAEVVHRVHRRRRGHINRWTYVVPFLQALQGYRFPMVDVVIEETGERLRGASVLVFNLPEYALGLPIVPGGKAKKGLLDLCVFERPGIAPLFLRYAPAIVGRRHQTLPDFQYRRVRRVRLSASEPGPLQTDGDPAGRLPARIEVIPDALTLVVPGG
jgi:diacylglycerol kinase family enzyme